jgi:hypothetical protein
MIFAFEHNIHPLQKRGAGAKLESGEGTDWLLFGGASAGNAVRDAVDQLASARSTSP